MTPQKKLIQLQHILSQLDGTSTAQRSEISRIEREIARLNKIIKGGRK